MAKGEAREKVVAALPGTVQEIARKVRSNDAAVREHLKFLALRGLAHVSRARPHRNKEPGPTWSAGPPGPDSPDQPKWAPRERKPKDREPNKPKPVNEDETIARARANPASWLSALGG